MLYKYNIRIGRARAWSLVDDRFL